MLKFFATDVSVSKGYDGSPALRFSESDGVSRVRFRVGKRVYDVFPDDGFLSFGLL